MPDQPIVITPTFFLETPAGLVPLASDSVIAKHVMPSLTGVAIVPLRAEKLRALGRPPKPKGVWENETPAPSDKKPTLVVVGGKETDG